MEKKMYEYTITMRLLTTRPPEEVGSVDHLKTAFAEHFAPGTDDIVESSISVDVLELP